MNNEDYQDLMESTKDHYRLMTHVQGNIHDRLNTALICIEMGLRNEDPNPLAQAYVLLEDIIKTLR